jgi:ABC-type glycerol-3-phosphate transport system substrate-binding protein
MPQIRGNAKQVNYANYWLEGVSAKTKNINEAWDFIQFETSQEQVQSYLKIAKKPTALRTLIKTQTDDLDIGVFADQVLTAQSWYHGKDSLAAEKAMSDMIDLTIKNEKEIKQIMEQGASKVQQTVF